jgi:serine protease
MVNDAGLGQYSVTVNRAGLPDGIHSATISATTDGGDALLIPVTAQVATVVIPGGDAGFVYFGLYLLDGTPVEGISREPKDGQYDLDYWLAIPGERQMYGGSDSDNDGFICDPGESCGFYGADSAAVFDVNRDLTDMNMSLNWAASLSGASSTSAASIPDSGFKVPKITEDGQQ